MDSLPETTMATETVPIKTEPESSDYEQHTHTQCRLCAKVLPAMLYIYSEEAVAKQFPEKINHYLPTPVSPMDSLPLFCCWSCHDTIIGWDEFVKICETSEEMLKSSLKLNDEDGFVNAVKGKKLDGFDRNSCPMKSEESNRLDSEFVSESDCVGFCEDEKSNNEYLLKCEVDSENELILDGYDNKEHILGSTPYSSKNFIQNLENNVPAKENCDNKKSEDGKIYVCEKCNFKFKCPRLQFHSVKRHATESTNYLCELCNRIFSKENCYRRHLNLHSIDRPHQCIKCKAHFHSQEHVNEHMKKHDGTIKFFCEFCGSCYSHKNYLSRHVKTCIYRLS